LPNWVCRSPRPLPTGRHRPEPCRCGGSRTWNGGFAMQARQVNGAPVNRVPANCKSS
jgi:hypothetical protein